MFDKKSIKNIIVSEFSSCKTEFSSLSDRESSFSETEFSSLSDRESSFSETEIISSSMIFFISFKSNSFLILTRNNN
jgi:hypothetical protein